MSASHDAPRRSGGSLKARSRQFVLAAAQRFAARWGLTLLPTWKLESLGQSEYVARVLDEWQVDSVIDVGANAGQYYDFLRQAVKFDGPVLSVEPIPQLAAELKARAARDPNLRVTNAALDALPGMQTFNIAEGSQFSSLLTPKKQMSEKFGGRTAITQTIEVSVLTLDLLMEEHAQFLGGRTYLKMDTQGFDLKVLRGLDKHSERVVALQSEASVVPIYDGMPSYVEAIDTITRRGFVVSQFFPNNDGHFPELLEFDCHFVRLNERRR